MATTEQERLAEELGFYALHKTEWLGQHPGKYVVIKGNDVLSFYPTFEAAYRAGADTWGINTDFLVKQIVEHAFDMSESAGLALEQALSNLHTTSFDRCEGLAAFRERRKPNFLGR